MDFAQPAVSGKKNFFLVPFTRGAPCNRHTQTRNRLLSVGVFTQLVNNIKGFAHKFLWKCVSTSCVNGALRFFKSDTHMSFVKYLADITSSLVVNKGEMGFIKKIEMERFLPGL